MKVNDASESKELWKLLEENITKIISENFGVQSPTKKEKKVKKLGNVEELES